MECFFQNWYFKRLEKKPASWKKSNYQDGIFCANASYLGRLFFKFAKTVEYIKMQLKNVWKCYSHFVLLIRKGDNVFSLKRYFFCISNTLLFVKSHSLHVYCYLWENQQLIVRFLSRKAENKQLKITTVRWLLGIRTERRRLHLCLPSQCSWLLKIFAHPVCHFFSQSKQCLASKAKRCLNSFAFSLSFPLYFC